MSSTPKRPRDTNQLAKMVVDIALNGETDDFPGEGKDPAAVALGRRGGLKGGKARSDSMTPEQRADIALTAARTRWNKSAPAK